MVQRPEELIQDNTIIMNKLDLQNQEESNRLTPEDIRRMNKQAISDLGNTAKTIFIGAKKGVYKNPLKFNDFRKDMIENNIEFSKKSIDSRIAVLSGYDNGEIPEQDRQRLLEEYSRDKELTILLDNLERQKKERDGVLKKMKTYREKYKDLDKEQLEVIDDIDDKLLRVIGNISGAIAEGFTDVTELAKNVAINSVSAGLGTAWKLGKIKTKAVGLAMDAVDNYLTMKYEDELINEDKPQLTQSDLIIGTVVALGTQGIIDGASSLIRTTRKIFKGELSKNLPDVANNIAQIKASATGRPHSDTSVKQILKEGYDAKHGQGEANKELFKKKMVDNPDLKYQQELDPNNPRIDVYDTANDYKLDVDNDSIIYQQKNTGIEKSSVTSTKAQELENKYAMGEITNEEFEVAHKKEIEDAKVKAEIGISVEENVKVDKSKLEKSKNKPIKISEEIQDSGSTTPEPKYKVPTKSDYLNYFGNEFVSGDVRVLETDTNKIIAYVDENKNVVRYIIDKAQEQQSYKQDPSIVNEHYTIRQLKNIKNARIEVLDDNGIKSITGMGKVAYWGKLRTIEKLNILIPEIKKMSERTAGIIYENKDGNAKARGVETQRALNVLVDDVIVKPIENLAQSIRTQNIKEFRKFMGDYYEDIGQFLEDCNEGALAELFITGQVNSPIFKKSLGAQTDELRLQGLTQWVDGLIENNTFYQAYKKQANIGDLASLSAEELAERYGKVFTLDSNGDLQYNTGKGGMFEGLSNKEIEAKILDLEINPAKIDLNLEKSIPDRDVYDEIFKETLTIDRQNGMAINQVFGNYKRLSKILSELGFYTRDEGGDIVSSLESFSQGIGRLVAEISNPDSQYSRKDLDSIVSLMYDFNKLPRRTVVEGNEVKGDVAMNLLDFVIKNKDNGYLSQRELHNIIEPHIEMLGYTIDYKSGNNKQKINIDKRVLKFDNEEHSNLTRMKELLNRWKDISEKQEGANAYFETEKYQKELAEFKELANTLSQDIDIKSLNDIQAVKYDGDINFDNIISKFDDTFDGVEAMANQYTDLLGDIQAINNFIGRKKNIANMVETEDYLTLLSSLQTRLKELGYTDDVIGKLNTESSKELRVVLKEIQTGATNKVDSGYKFLNNLSDLDGLDTPEKVQDYLKRTRNRKKVNSLLDTMKEYGADETVVENIRDFVNYNGKEYDYKLNKEKIVSNLSGMIETIQKMSDDIDVKKYGERQKAYSNIQDAYDKINFIIRTDVGDSSIKFLKNTDIDKLFDIIIDNGKIVGEDMEDILIYKEVFKSLQALQKNIIDVQQNSPMKNLQKSFVSKFKKYTTKDKERFGRLEAVINKLRWLNDKGFYNQTDETHMMKVLFSDYEDISQVPEGVIEKYIRPEDQLKFKNFYDYAVQYFRGNEIYDNDGNLITTEQLTIDQFAVLYAHFLDELSQTTRANKNRADSPTFIGALKNYFKSDEDMFKFFTGRQDMYGAGYVKDNGQILVDFNERTARDLAEVSVLGTSLYSFATKVSPTNKVYKNVEKKHFLKDTVDGKTLRKESNKNQDDLIVNTISEMLKTSVTKSSPIKSYGNVLSKNWNNFVSGAINILYPILLNATGLGEIGFNRMMVTSKNAMRDKRGRSFGYGTSPFGALALYPTNVVKGLRDMAVNIPHTVYNSTVGVIDAMLVLDDFFGISNYLNRRKGTDISLTTKDIVQMGYNKAKSKLLNGAQEESVDRIERMIANGWSKLEPADKVVLRACRDDLISKELSKGKKQYSSPRDLKFKGNKWNYTKEAFGEAWDTFTTHAMAVQEQSDMHRSIVANIKSRDLMEELSVKSYESLPEGMVATLRRYGIDSNNYSYFLENLNAFKKNGELDIYLRDLIGQIPENKKLQSMDMSMLESIQGIANHFYNVGFDLDPTAKYSPKAESAINKITMALRRTTAGIALGDITRLGYDQTEYGTMEAKWRRFTGDQTATDVIRTSLANSKSIPIYVLSTMALGQGTLLLDDIARKPDRLISDASQTMAELSVIVTGEDDDEKKGFLKSFGYLMSLAGKYSSNVMTVGALFNQSNIFDVYNQIGGEFYKSLIMMANDPHDVDQTEINKTLAKLGMEARYDKLEHMEQGRIIPILSFMSTLFAKHGLKVPVSYYNLVKKTYDFKEQDKDIKRLRKNDNETVGRRASEIYDTLIGMGNKDEDIQDVMIPVPEWDELSEDGKVEIGAMYFDMYSSQATELSTNIKEQSFNIITGANQLFADSGVIDETEYNQRQEDLYNKIGIDEEFEQLPIQYKIALEDIISTYDNPTSLEIKKLKATAMDILNNDSTIKPLELVNLLADDPQKVTGIIANQNKEQKKQIKFKTFDELPSIYKVLYENTLQSTPELTQEEFLWQINNKSIREK